MTKDQEPKTPEGIFVPLSPVSINRLYMGKVPMQPRYEDKTIEAFYLKLAMQPLYPYRKTQGDTEEIVVACPPVTGKELQQLFHFTAPSKLFGVDYRDTQTDWDKLYSDPRNQNRLAAHRGLPGWDQFEQKMRFIHTFIGDDLRSTIPSRDRVAALIHIVSTNDKLTWNFDPAVDNQQTQEMAKHFGNLLTRRPNFLPILGPAFIAAYSPATTQAWGDKLNYQLKNEGTKQDMGSTQSLALSIAKCKTLFHTPLLQALLTYTHTGKLPEV